MTTLDARFKRTVSAYLKRTGMSPGQLGLSAIENRGFVSTLNRGYVPSLETADRVLRFMGEPTIGDAFRREIEAFLRVTEYSDSRFGTEAVGNSSFVGKLRNGASPHLATVERVQAWMRSTARGSQRAAIARAREASGDAAPALSPRPAKPARRPKVTKRPASCKETAPDGEPPPYHRKAFLSTRESAAFLSLSPDALRRLRLTGEGPAYCRFGERIAYARADILVWVWEQRRSTRESD